MEAREATLAVSEAPPPTNGDGRVNGNGNGGGIATMAIPAPSTPEAEVTTQDDGVPADEPVEMVAPADAGQKFMFRAWFLTAVFMILKRFVKNADLAALFAAGPTPKDGEAIRKAWRRLLRLREAVQGGDEGWRGVLMGILSGTEKKMAEGEYDFPAAAKVVKGLREVAYGLAWTLNQGERVRVVNDIRRLDVEQGWFGLASVVMAERERRAAARRARDAESAAREREEERLAEAAEDIGDLLGLAADAGVALEGTVQREVLTAAASRLPNVGDLLKPALKQVVMKDGSDGEYFVGLLFEQLPGRKEHPFLPASKVPSGLRFLSDEVVEEYEARLRGVLVHGSWLLTVEAVEEREGRTRVLVQLRTSEEAVALAANSKHIPFARPPKSLEVGQALKARVVATARDGFSVVAAGNRLYVHQSEVAEGLTVSVGDCVYGVVIPGYGGREYDFAIREVISPMSTKDDEPASPECILHAGRVEEIRLYVVDSAMEVGEAAQATLKDIVEMAANGTVLAAEQREEVNSFLTNLLAEVERSFPPVIVTRQEMEAEAADAAEESRGEGDTRSFCRNHEAANGQRCNRRVKEDGALCSRCQKRAEGHRPTPGGKKRGLKGKHKKG